ncbi:MAG: Sir2 silent information regulator family NAD-dependent deacetylase [Clostridia bacterium]|nr:Sir2 silent information regulator family NAD-dependent deacetylase [Clostridia bacterium]
MQANETYAKKIEKIRELINNADAVAVGAGAGLSTSAGFTYSGRRFHENFHDFEMKYGFRDMYSGGFYPYPSAEEKWAFWSRYVYINRYTNIPGTAYADLFDIVKNEEYFVITTNVDHCFQKSGFDKKRLFYTQGDYGLFQCSKPCHNKTYDNEEIIKKMYSEQKDMKIPSELIPKCPVCGRPMAMNLRADDTFVEDDGWKKAAASYARFLKRYEDKAVVFLELGVGGNTPVIIKYPFWRMTYANEKAAYITINLGEAVCPDYIAERSVCLEADIGSALKDLRSLPVKKQV